MKKRIFKPVSYVLILALGLAMTFTSCENTPKEIDLPPKASLQMDLDVFPSQSATKLAVDTTAVNWFTSLVKVGVWNLGIAANIIIPVTAYAEAFKHEAVYLGDNAWEWSYSFTVGDAYGASLIGERLNNDEFSMTMYLSKSGMDGFEDFEWFSGVIRYDHTEALWSMNHSPEDPVAYLEIVFHKDFEKGTSDIRYTCVDPDNELYNGYIEYGIDPAFDYDAYYTISRTEGTSYIEWSTETAAGRVMDEAQYGDDAWHCWDSLLKDVNCPE